MKLSHLMTFTLLLITAILIGSIGCAGPGGVHDTQKQIATACAGVTAAANSIAAAKEAGKVSKADALDAAALVRLTVPFCEPKPVDHLSAADFSILLNVADELTARKERIR